MRWWRWRRCPRFGEAVAVCAVQAAFLLWHRGLQRPELPCSSCRAACTPRKAAQLLCTHTRITLPCTGSKAARVALQSGHVLQYSTLCLARMGTDSHVLHLTQCVPCFACTCTFCSACTSLHTRANAAVCMPCLAHLALKHALLCACLQILQCAHAAIKHALLCTHLCKYCSVHALQ